jgi:hypothetical protein
MVLMLLIYASPIQLVRREFGKDAPCSDFLCGFNVRISRSCKSTKLCPRFWTTLRKTWSCGGLLAGRGKAAVNRAQSRRFARPDVVRGSRSGWTAAASAPLSGAMKVQAPI